VVVVFWKWWAHVNVQSSPQFWGIAFDRLNPFMANYINLSRSQRSCGLKRRCAAARLLRLWIRIPGGVMDVFLL
jgi:hypothetical protein